MLNVGQRERATQNRLVQFFQRELGYRYRRTRGCNKNTELKLIMGKTVPLSWIV